MDMSRLSQGQMIAGVGGILLIISQFLSWTFGGASAFDVFSGMDIIMLLVGIAAVAYAVLPAIGAAQNLPPRSSGILLLLAVAVLGFTFGDDIEDPYADIGAWLALVSSAAIAFGALQGLTGGRPAAPRGTGRMSTSSTPPPPPPTV